MIVYVLLHGEFGEGADVVGVFSTYEAAEWADAQLMNSGKVRACEYTTIEDWAIQS